MDLPAEVTTIISTLRKRSFDAYAVGGCVRDVLMHRQPKDWDVATSAKPEDIQRLFPRNFYANRFGTVTVLTGSADAALKEIEVTTYRIDADYSDQRHPDAVEFTADIEEDLARRDFTVNAMAMDQNEIIDPFEGQQDLAAKIIRAVGKPTERFAEDALRLLRAVRLAADLNFEIEEYTNEALTQHASAIKTVSHERVRDELIKIVMSGHPEAGFNLLRRTGLLALLLPEIAEGVGVEQNKHHIYTVFDHNVKSLQYAARYHYPLHIRLAALLHDIGKPRTKRKQAGDYTFYAHDIVGAGMAVKLMKRLRFPNKLITKVVHLVRHHMFYYDVGKITEAGVRRLLRRVSPEHFDDLIKLRIAERKGSGVPKAEPYRLRHLQFMAEKVAQQPITTGQLAISGHDLMTELDLKPSPIIGGILNALLAEVLEDPKKNERRYLLTRAGALINQDPEVLKHLGAKAVETEEQKREDEIRRKYHV
jgi:tRNA nucleotidyltransferase (CCA-adding enzyme)